MEFHVGKYANNHGMVSRMQVSHLSVFFSALWSLSFLQDQMAVFQTPAEDVCHFVLASNVAESSLTLPNVSAVVDLGMNKQQVTLVDLFFCWLWPFFAGRNRGEIDFGFGWVVVFCWFLCRFLEGPNMEPLFWDKDRNVIVTKGIGPCTPRRKTPQPLSKKKQPFTRSERCWGDRDPVVIGSPGGFRQKLKHVIYKSPRD